MREPISSKRTVFVHMRKVPNQAAQKIRRVLTDPLYELAPELPAGIRIIRRSRFRIPPSEVPSGIAQKLASQREATVLWKNIRPIIRKKQWVDKWNPDLDDESESVQDSDLNG